MAKAILTYIDENGNNIPLESGSLFYIDQNTKIYKNIAALKENYSLKTDNIKGKLKLFYISSTSQKDELPILLNDDKPIHIKDDYLEEKTSEIEKGRKLLFNSKNKLFLRLALRYKLVKDTFNYRVELTKKQYDYALKNNLTAFFEEGHYFIDAKELFGFIISANRAQLLREPFEKSLDNWKRSINNMTLEDLYYYSRNIRLLINKYNDRIRRNIGIKNFEPRNKNLRLLKSNTVSLGKTGDLIKVRRKIKE